MDREISEEYLQYQCYTWAFNTFPQIRGLLFRIKNELAKHPGETVKAFRMRLSQAKGTGIYPGVCDLLLLQPLTAIELKLPNGTQSEEQKEWEQKIRAASIPYHLLRSLEEFKQLIGQYYK